MRRRMVCFLTALTLLIIASSTPLSANDGTSLNDNYEEGKPIVYSTADPHIFNIDKGASIVNVSDLFSDTEYDPADFHFVSDTVEVFTASNEIWPTANSLAATNGCSPGQHQDVYVMKTSSSIFHTPTSFAQHRAFCTFIKSSSWICHACKTTGKDNQFTLFYCDDPKS